MEFAIRLSDETNKQVFCLNPVHKGNHMDRVFYEDNTFNAPCPACGSDEWLYRKNNAISKKGHFLTFKPDDRGWGSNELKHFGFVRIDCTEEQAKGLCEGIRNEQAIVNAESYREQADARRGIIVNNIRDTMPWTGDIEELKAIHIAIKEALESDTEYLTLRFNERQSENRAQIDYRPCKNSLDFEKVLSVSELKGWNDMEKPSKIVDIDYNTVTINMTSG